MPEAFDCRSKRGRRFGCLERVAGLVKHYRYRMVDLSERYEVVGNDEKQNVNVAGECFQGA